MKSGNLKKIRVAVSLLFFVLTGWSFLNIYEILPPSWINTILFLQFIPSVTKFSTLLSLASIGFIVILLATLLFGRAYCSTICPLGTFQDVVTYASRRMARKKHRRQREFTILRYGLLVVAAITALTGTLTILNLLDPFSSFGRMATDLVLPVVVSGNNLLVSGLERVGIYSLYPVPVNVTGLASLIVALLTLATLVWMSYRHGRLYCNSVCPVGALLGFISKVSVYRIAISREQCISCNLCEEVCKGGCIDKKARTLDFTRCVGCYNCLSVCPKDGLGFRNALVKVTSGNDRRTDYSRREMMLNSGLVIAASFGTTQTGVKKIISTKDSTVAVVRTLPCTPPGGRSIAHFTSRCTACHLCIGACPSRVLVPSLFEYGPNGIMQPKMAYDEGYCNYECVACTLVCPSGALLPLAQDQKKLTQVGTAKFVKDNCIVYTEEKDCGACSEHCPTKAVRMVPYKHLTAPEVKDEFCIGCGACEHSCPTKPFKAIYVDGKAVHTVAKKPEEKKLEEKVQEEFPF